MSWQNQKTMREQTRMEDEVPETMLKSLVRKVKNTSREEFDLEEEAKDVVDSQIKFLNHYQSNERFRQKFSQMIFDQYLEEV